MIKPDLALARQFYGGVLGLEEGRSSKSWIDYNFFGHQVVMHLVQATYRCADHFNPVDADDVPVPHFGCALPVEDFHEMAVRLRQHKVKFIVEPHIRFAGMPGEQWVRSD
jgi:extradiol dioxygenase family protein